MDELAGFFWILPVGCALIGLALAMVWWWQPAARAAGWASGGFLLSGTVTMIDVMRTQLPMELAAACVPLQWVSLALITQAFLVRCDTSLPWRLLAPLWLAGSAVHLYSFLVVPDAPLRSQLANGLTLVIVGAGAIRLALLRPQGIDRIGFAMVTAGALLYLWRTISAFAHPVQLANSNAWVGDAAMLALYLGNTLVGLCIALVLFLVIGTDLISQHYRETRTDALTGLGNRRALDDVIERDHRGDSYFGAALMIDLDHFKRINDRFGHAAGDRILQQVGAILSGQFKGLAEVIRVGGEEFSVLVPSENTGLAKSLALVTLGSIGSVEVPGDHPRQTCSVGVALRLPGESVRDMLRRADVALYQAKAQGRDRIVTAADKLVFGDNGPDGALGRGDQAVAATG